MSRHYEKQRRITDSLKADCRRLINQCLDNQWPYMTYLEHRTKTLYESPSWGTLTRVNKSAVDSYARGFYDALVLPKTVYGYWVNNEFIPCGSPEIQNKHQEISQGGYKCVSVWADSKKPFFSGLEDK